MKLYYHPKTRATRVRWTLEELGVDYDLIRVDMANRQHKTPDFLALSPFGTVPVLELDGSVLFESSAMCLALAARHPEAGLAPANPDVYQWFSFAVVTLEPAILAAARARRQGQPADVIAATERAAAQAIDHVTQHVQDGRQTLTGPFSLADILVGTVLRMLESYLNWPTPEPLQPYVRRLQARPAYPIAFDL